MALKSSVYWLAMVVLLIIAVLMNSRIHIEFGESVNTRIDLAFPRAHPIVDLQYQGTD